MVDQGSNAPYPPARTLDITSLGDIHRPPWRRPEPPDTLFDSTPTPSDMPRPPHAAGPRPSSRLRPLVGVVCVVVGAAWPGVMGAQLPIQPDAPPVFLPATALEAALPQSSVYGVVEDRDGFLWFATREGVARWDGREVRVWRHDPFDDASIPGNVIRTLVQDARGDIWATVYDYLQVPVGVARLLAPTFTEVRRYDHPGAGVGLDATGQPILLEPDSISRFDAATDAFHPAAARALPTGPRNSLFEPPGWVVSPDAWLWIADNEGVERCRLDPAPRCEVVSDSKGGGAMVIDPSGALWVATERGVDQLDPTRPDRAPVIVDLGTAPADLAVDSAGVLWALTQDGVVRVRDGGRLDDASMPTVGDRSALAAVCIHIDRAGTVRVGTVWGVFAHEPARKAFAHLEHDPDDPQSPASGLVSALAEDPDGAIWIGTIGGGLNRWDPRTGRVERFRHLPGDDRSLPHDVVWDLVLDDTGTLWVGTSDGLARREPGVGGFQTFRRVAGEPYADATPNANTIQDLQLDSAGRLWAPCTGDCGETLPWFDPATESFELLDVPGLRRAGYLALDPSGSLWVGTTDGIDRIDPDTGHRESPDDTGGLDGVLAFHFSGSGELWVGSNSGLYRLDSEGQVLARFTTSDGLPSNAVYGILEDDRRRLWLSTNRGLAMLDPDEPAGTRIRSYDGTTGVANVEFNRNAYLEASDGTFFFGGDRGLTWFHPTRIRDNDYRPPVAITALERASASAVVREVVGPDSAIRIRPEEESFSLEFAALSYVNAHRNQYRVQLEGFDEGWRDLGTIARATYTRVPPGDYNFRVQGANEDGVWSDTEGHARVVVEPWLWETNWFRLGGALLLASLIAALAVLRSRSRYRDELARLHAAGALERERGRLSRDMHDEVGASLTEIAILSDVALSHADPDPTIRTDTTERLRRIGTKSREAIDAIAGIIWAIDPDRAGNRVGAHLREYAAEVLESAELDAQLDFPPSGDIPALSAEARRALLLVLKEALANVIRHAEASRVTVRLSPEPDTVRLRVEDDGVGLSSDPPITASGAHDGLRNMRRRAHSAGGGLSIESTPGQGTAIELWVPVGEIDP